MCWATVHPRLPLDLLPSYTECSFLAGRRVDLHVEICTPLADFFPSLDFTVWHTRASHVTRGVNAPDSLPAFS